MRIMTTIPIKDLLAQLPPNSIAYTDLRCLSAVKECIKALRAEYDSDPPSLFTTEVRHALALELNDALAQIIKARIPKNPVGRPRSTAAPAQEAKQEAKVQLEAERKELQTLKRLNLELREALEKFERTCIDTAGLEPLGSLPDASARHAKLDPGLPLIHHALNTLADASFPRTEIEQQVTAMYTLYDELQLSVTRWCGTTAPAAGKAQGVHKGKALAGWLEACKKLGRDIAEELRNLK